MNKSHQNQIRLMPPLDSIIGDIDKCLEKLEGDLDLFNKKMVRFEERMKKFEKGIEAFDEKMDRIEKYAK